MIQKVMSNIDISILPEIALAMFAFIFVTIVIRTLLMRSDTEQQQAAIVLGDREEEMQ